MLGLFRALFKQRQLPFRPPEHVFQPFVAQIQTDVGNQLPPCFAAVTGGNTGIGFETAYHLAKCGARVVIGSRSKRRGDEAITRMQTRAGKKLDVHCSVLDLSDLSSVKEFADAVKQLLGSRNLQLMVNNAGVMNVPYQKSKQGHELTFATNHLGHFLLTQLLVPLMQKPGGRVVVVTSQLHDRADGASSDYTYGSAMQAYARSKLANVWHAYELQRREPQLVVPVVSPGLVSTTLGTHGILAPILMLIKRLLFITPEQGARATLHCSLADDVEGSTYYHNSKGIIPTSPLSYDQEKARELWELSSQLVQPFS